jgi:ATP-dependent 26S proteasome regulatory subunit
MTTNHPELLDEALTRPGRVDYNLEIGYSGDTEINQFLSNFYQEDIKIENSLKRISMAKVQSICLSTKTRQEAVRQINLLMK